jgi:hypothetical protein
MLRSLREATKATMRPTRKGIFDTGLSRPDKGGYPWSAEVRRHRPTKDKKQPYDERAPAGSESEMPRIGDAVLREFV